MRIPFSMRRLAPAVALVCVVLWPVCVAASEATAEEALEVDALTGEWWYAVSLHGHKVGHVHVTIEVAESDGQRVVVESAQMVMALRVDDKPLRYAVVTTEVYEAAPPYRLLQMETEERRGSRTKRLRIERDGDEFAVTRLVHGRTTTKRVAASRKTLRDVTAEWRLARGEPAVGDTVTRWSFDEDELVDEQKTATVVGVVREEWQGQQRRIVVLQDENEGAVSRYLDDGTLLEVEYAEAARLTLGDKETVTAPADDDDMYNVRNRVPVAGLDLEGEEIAALTIAVTGVDKAVFLDLPTQRVTRREDGAFVIELRAGELPAEAAITDEDRERLAEYLEATEALQVDDARIRRRARRIVRRKTDPVEQVRAISAWVYRHVEGADFADYETALDVLIHLEGDCTEHTLLFVALCRAAGIPAREVGGLVYAGPAAGEFAFHAWAQVYVGGWIDVDPSFDQVPADATHVAVDEDHDGTTTLLGALPHVEIKVVSVEARSTAEDEPGESGAEKSLP